MTVSAYDVQIQFGYPGVLGARRMSWMVKADHLANAILRNLELADEMPVGRLRKKTTRRAKRLAQALSKLDRGRSDWCWDAVDRAYLEHFIKTGQVRR